MWVKGSPGVNDYCHEVIVKFTNNFHITLNIGHRSIMASDLAWFKLKFEYSLSENISKIVFILNRNTEPSWPVLEIPTGLPVRGWQLWRRTLFVDFLQYYVYDLRFKAWGPTTFLTEFQTLIMTVIVLTYHSWLHCEERLPYLKDKKSIISFFSQNSQYPC